MIAELGNGKPCRARMTRQTTSGLEDLGNSQQQSSSLEVGEVWSKVVALGMVDPRREVVDAAHRREGLDQGVRLAVEPATMQAGPRLAEMWIGQEGQRE